MTPADHRRIRLVSEAVVSGYIREISTRAGSGDAPEPARAPARRADRLSHARRVLRSRQELAHARRAHHAARRAVAGSSPHHRSA
jgi:hypothetical protein